MPYSLRAVNPEQRSRYDSPWPRSMKIRLILWRIVYTLLFLPTPSPLNGWRLFLLRAFGAKLSGRPYVAPSARIWAPWHLTMEDRACVGAEVDLYNLARITLREACTVGQQSYLCTGTHDLDSPVLTLMAAEIEIGRECFLGARTFVLPGVIMGEHSVAGAASVVTKDVAPRTIVAGNPARVIRQRA